LFVAFLAQRASEFREPFVKSERKRSSSGFLRDLSFEEGTVVIGDFAFSHSQLQRVTFPACLAVIGESAFEECQDMSEATFPANSQLQCIRRRAFREARPSNVVLPAGLREIDPAAFDEFVWELVTFAGPPPFVIRNSP
jgi:hypothetical protein